MTPKELRRKINLLPSRAPLAERFDQTLASLGQTHRNEWWKNHKEHWLGWLEEYDGPGFYGRASAKRSAEFVYNHINCPPMLVWLAEASGIPKREVTAAIQTALNGPKPWPSQCGRIRRAIPWPHIEARLVS